MLTHTTFTRLLTGLVLLAAITSSLWPAQPVEAQSSAIDVEVVGAPSANTLSAVDQLVGSEFFGIASLEDRVNLWLQLPPDLTPGDLAISNEQFNTLRERARRDRDAVLEHQKSGWAYNLSQSLGERGLTHLNAIIGSLGEIATTDPYRATANEPECGFDVFCYVTWLADSAASWLAGINNWVSKFVFGVAVSVSIDQFKSWADAGGGVSTAWATVRNFANLGLIFMLLYAAASLVFNLKVDAGKMVMNVIIIALLINFSAFFTRLIIDASNILTRGIYNLFDGGLAHQLKVAMGLPAEVQNSVWSAGLMFGGLANALLRILFSLVAMFVVGAISLLLIIRAVRLVILMVISPLAFLAYTNPKTEKLWQEWWKTLIADAFFPPAMFLMLLVSLQIGIAITDSFSGNGWSVLNASVFRFVIMTIFLIAALVIAKKMGAAGVDAAMRWSSKGTRAWVGAGGLAARFGGRAVQGIDKWSGGRIYGKSEIKRGGSWINKNLVSPTLKRVDKAAPGLATARKQTVTALKTPLKTASEVMASLTKPYGVSVGIAGETKEEGAARRKQEEDDKKVEKDKELNQLKQNFDQWANGLSPQNENDVKNNLKKIKQDDLTKMDQGSLEKLAHLLSDDQMKKLSGELTSEKYQKIQVSREKPLEEAVRNKNEADVRRLLEGYGSARLTNLSEETLTNPTVVKQLSAEMYRAIQSSDNVNFKTKEKIFETVKNDPAHRDHARIMAMAFSQGGKTRRNQNQNQQPSGNQPPTPPQPPAPTNNPPPGNTP